MRVEYRRKPRPAGERRVFLGTSPLALVLGSPFPDGFVREPDGDVASVSERPVVLSPVGDPVLFLVLVAAVPFVCFLHCGLLWIEESNGWEGICARDDRDLYVQPKTWVTLHSKDMGDTFMLAVVRSCCVLIST